MRDGAVWTSAGVTAGIDLGLALVEEDLGPEVPREVARWLVVFLQRPGGRAQFSSHLAGAPASREPQAWMADNLDEDLRVETLAARAAMSPRNFARAFRRETGLTPAAYVEALRVEAARQRLERGAEPVDIVAHRAGFGTPETMRRAFARRVGVAPAQYRAASSGHPTKPEGERQVQIAYLLYERFTALDITGPHGILDSVPGTDSVFVAEHAGPIRNESGTIAILANRSFDEVPRPDIVVVPGGLGTRLLLEDEPLSSWLRSVHETSTWTTSVCTGSLLLAAAGLLDDAPATTHWLARDTLASLGARPVPDRVVRHGKSSLRGGLVRHRHGAAPRATDARRRSRAGNTAGDRIRPPAPI